MRLFSLSHSQRKPCKSSQDFGSGEEGGDSGESELSFLHLSATPVFSAWQCRTRVPLRRQVVLRRDVTGLGKTGELTKVPNGYYRNWLLPQGLAAPATEGILACAPLPFCCAPACT